MKGFSRLQGKLTLSYALVTTLVLMIVNFLLGYLDFAQALSDADQLAQEQIPADLAANLATLPPLLQDPSHEQLEAWMSGVSGDWTLEINSGDSQLLWPLVQISILDAQGGEIAHQIAPFGQDYVALSAEPELATALQARDAYVFYLADADLNAIAMPITEGERRLGVVVLLVPPFTSGGLSEWLPTFLATLAQSAALALAIGLVFGYFTSRGLVRRLGLLGQSAAQWSQGRFSERVFDETPDEIGDLSRDFNRMAAQLETLVETRRQLATLDERGRIARELHDTVKQQLFSVGMHLSSLELELDRESAAGSEQAAQILEDLAQLNRETQQELSGLIDVLRPTALADLGLAGAIESFAQKWAAENDIACEVNLATLPELPINVELAFYRILQEGLNNVGKHAGAQRAQIRLELEQEELSLTVSDDGRGLATEAASAGKGLSIMRERMQALGGQFTVESSPQSGTELRASLKLGDI